MYEEPYKWVEAVGNRRQYLDEQFKQGSPVVALAYEAGILLLTVSKGTPKLYEIYDRLALGGMGHPADLEKLRFSLLEMAHVEGFNRSPSDATGRVNREANLYPVIKLITAKGITTMSEVDLKRHFEVSVSRSI